MAKGKHARSRRSGGKKGRGTNPQTSRNRLASGTDDALTQSESIGFNGTLPGGEGMDEEGEGQHPESSSVPAFKLSFPHRLLYTPYNRCHNHGANSNVGQFSQTLLTARSI